MKLYFKTVSQKIIDNIRTGQSVRDERKKCSISLRSVARELGISAPYLSDLELGRRNWTEELFNKVKQSLAQSTMQEARKKK